LLQVFTRSPSEQLDAAGWLPNWPAHRGTRIDSPETQVLGAITNGKSNKEIGVAFEHQRSDGKVHVTHILEKLKQWAHGSDSAAAQRGLSGWISGFSMSSMCVPAAPTTLVLRGHSMEQGTWEVQVRKVSAWFLSSLSLY